MNSIGKIFLRGLGFVVPVSITLYLIYTIVMTSERAIGGAIKSMVPQEWYLPGFGLIIAIALVFVIGLLVHIPVFKLLVPLTDWLFDRMPLVRSVYSILKDFGDFISTTNDSENKGRPVLVDIAPGKQIIGLLTNDNLGHIKQVPEGSVIVYLPMSYQIGGYSIIMSKDKLTELDKSMEEAMSFVVTAGIRSKANK